MLPYCLAILVFWAGMLQVWIWLDVPLGPEGPLHYAPALESAVNEK
jgi:aminobenzoyl-glutamate transport protein